MLELIQQHGHLRLAAEHRPGAGQVGRIDDYSAGLTHLLQGALNQRIHPPIKAKEAAARHANARAAQAVRVEIAAVILVVAPGRCSGRRVTLILAGERA